MANLDEIKARYIELGKIIRSAQDEQEAINDTLATYAPFKEGDIITDGQKIMRVERVLCFGVDTDNEINFVVDGVLFKKDGSLGQRGHRVGWNIKNWFKRPLTKAKATASDLEKLEAWNNAR